MHIGIDFLASFEKVRKIELICLHARYVCSCVYLFDLVLSPPPCQVSEADSNVMSEMLYLSSGKRKLE